MHSVLRERAGFCAKVLVLAMTCIAGIASASPIDRIGEKLQDVTLPDLDGKPQSLLSFHDGELLVIAYTGVGCPISGRYGTRLQELSEKFAKRGVKFVGINAGPQDSPEEIRAEMKEVGVKFPVLHDKDQVLTKQLDAKTTTVAFVVDKDNVIRYRGMVDDQYVVGALRDRPRIRYLERSIRAVLAGNEPEEPRTVAPGCLITRIDKPTKSEEITYSSHIKRILQDNCEQCHRPGQVGPFPLQDYDTVRGWSAMMYSVVHQGRMPPWNAHPDYHGKFANERAMPEEEKKMLLAWIENGMPRGNPEEDPEDRRYSQMWRIGRPDKVFTMKTAYEVPPEGVVEYQYFSIPTSFRDDMWVTAMEARPGAADVVHHILAFVTDSQGRTDNSRLGLEDGYLAAQVPGDIPSVYPEGYGKRIPAGSNLVLQLHYTTNGKKRKDKSKIALRFSDEPPTYEVKTRGIYNDRFTIPAGAENHEVRSEHTFEEDTKVLALYPHMHFRGKDWKYVAHYPDGKSETLLYIPEYDYNWQESYVLSEPIVLPKGTRLECIAHFDNSASNFQNPDPTVEVKFGEQSWEEMMIGYIDYVVENPGA